MSSIIKAAGRRRACALSSATFIPLLALGISTAEAQQAPPDQLPPIEVSAPVQQTQTRARPTTDDGYGTIRTAPKVPPATTTSAAPASTTNAPTGNTGQNLQPAGGIVGAASTVITAEDIARSPAQTVQEIIAQVRACN